MGNLFGTTLTPAEMLKESQAKIRRCVWDLEMERGSLQRDETRMQLEIKQVAKKGQMQLARAMAKELVRTRNTITKLFNTESQLKATGRHIQTMSSTATMSDAMRS